jgi:hypothetical protein
VIESSEENCPATPVRSIAFVKAPVAVTCIRVMEKQVSGSPVGSWSLTFTSPSAPHAISIVSGPSLATVRTVAVTAALTEAPAGVAPAAIIPSIRARMSGIRVVEARAGASRKGWGTEKG